MELDNQPRCCLRLDWIERYRAVVSINVDPDYHAQGIGYKSLSALKEIFPNLCIEAKVFPENVASQKLFQRAGFLQKKKDIFAFSLKQ